MKNKKLMSTILILLSSLSILSQVVPAIDNVFVNGVPINNCSTISFGTNESLEIDFRLRINKQSDFNVGNFATFRLYIRKNNSSNPQFINGIMVPNNAFSNNGTYWEGTFSETLYASDIEVSGSNFFWNI